MILRVSDCNEAINSDTDASRFRELTNFYSKGPKVDVIVELPLHRSEIIWSTQELGDFALAIGAQDIRPVDLRCRSRPEI